ncbi:Leucine-, isoleucine-, valine-, threonine-, and alanine-binding protein [Usitatibacter rugosus]|uniref:Leucine-, isoleucine-, valine-, threonine-, and alanine-binding protein n=1 Tax=Usitatibacter rugosus TaxID=2732067 RepID=A0A6M4GS71_9PROT|nr:branched-chain amino acid ABC transporter substrate-binding protein [Usitatibacter rugosus]QJR09163.1 Leucine-, isoleucine-, valine-, threonine-, and alanine-binding protein [Usitatibacter rugosus]
MAKRCPDTGWFRKVSTTPSPLLALILFSLAACGKTEAPAPPASDTITVTIAHAGPLTGSIAHQGKDDENGVNLALDQANAKKLKIGGKTVTFKILSEDDQGDPKLGTLVAQKFVDAKVAAVIGHLNSGVTIPASEIYAKAGIPVISGSATNPDLTERKLKGVFRTVGRDDQQGPAIAAYIAGELKAKSVAIVDDKTAYGEGLATEVDKSLRKAGVTMVGRERTTDKETDFKSILTRIKSRNPDVIFHGGMDATGGLMLKQARELGMKSVFAFGDGACTEEMAQLAGPAGEGLACSQAGLPAEAASKEFLDAFTKKYGPTKLYAPFFYDATNVVIEAMRRADSVDPAKFTPEMYNVSLAGATGKLEFDAKGDRKDAEMTIFRMQGGKIVPVAVVKGGVATPFTK